MQPARLYARAQGYCDGQFPEWARGSHAETEMNFLETAPRRHARLDQ
jgi:hypothetical protein